MKINTNGLVRCWGAIASGNAWLANGKLAGFVFLAIAMIVLAMSMERNQ